MTNRFQLVVVSLLVAQLVAILWMAVSLKDGLEEVDHTLGLLYVETVE